MSFKFAVHDACIWSRTAAAEPRARRISKCFTPTTTHELQAVAELIRALVGASLERRRLLGTGAAEYRHVGDTIHHSDDDECARPEPAGTAAAVVVRRSVGRPPSSARPPSLARPSPRLSFPQ